MKTQTSSRRSSSRVQYGLRDTRSISGKAWAFPMPKEVNRARGQEFRIVRGDSYDRYEYTIREVLQGLEAAARSNLESAEDFDGMLRDSEAIREVACLMGAKAIVEQWAKEHGEGPAHL